MSPSDMKQAQGTEQETVTGQRAMRKLRWRILPFILLLFVIALIDRNNISLAALTMNKELAITGQQFGLVFGIFFLGYFVFEIPSNLLLHRMTRCSGRSPAANCRRPQAGRVSSMRFPARSLACPQTVRCVSRCDEWH